MRADTGIKEIIMNRLILAIAAAAMLAGGCQEAPPLRTQASPDAWLVTTVNDTAVRNAIIRQSAFFPYHFETGGADLNELGRHDMEVLATHHKTYPGRITVRQGDASAALYKARVARIVEGLDRAGIRKGRVTISDGPVAGDGRHGDKTLVILQKSIADTPSGGGGESTDTISGGSEGRLK